MSADLTLEYSDPSFVNCNIPIQKIRSISPKQLQKALKIIDTLLFLVHYEQKPFLSTIVQVHFTVFSSQTKLQLVKFDERFDNEVAIIWSTSSSGFKRKGFPLDSYLNVSRPCIFGRINVTIFSCIHKCLISFTYEFKHNRITHIKMY